MQISLRLEFESHRDLPDWTTGVDLMPQPITTFEIQAELQIRHFDAMFDNAGNDTVDRMSDPKPATGWQVVTWRWPGRPEGPFRNWLRGCRSAVAHACKADGSRGRVTCQLDPISSEELPH
jgi:hypothetical protein